MLKFFRQIRQNLLLQNKTSKYFKYAIGEIILVVIGILIALQINNWNENRKQKAIEISYLKRLLIDLEKDKNLWTSTYNKRKSQVTTIQKLIGLNYSQQSDTLNFLTVGSLLKSAAMWSDINPNQDTFSEMLSSGNLDIIKNDSIKIKLIDLNSNYKAVANWDDTTEKAHSKVFESTMSVYDIRDMAPFDPLFAEYTDLKISEEQKAKAMMAIQKSFKNLLNTKEMFNYLHMMSDNYHRQLPLFKELETDINTLIQLIKNEITTKTND